MAKPTKRVAGLAVATIVVVFGLSLWGQLLDPGGFGQASDGVLGVIACIAMMVLLWFQPGLPRIDRIFNLVFWGSVLLLWVGYLAGGPEAMAQSENLETGMVITVPLVVLSFAAALVHKVVVAWKRGFCLVFLNLVILAITIFLPMYDYPVLFWSVVLVFLAFAMFEWHWPPIKKPDLEDSPE